jgi:glycosyltransferase involved in cell wall biosynthesis
MDSPGSALNFAVYGLFDIQCGLRVAAENTVRVLEQRGQGLRLESIQPDGSVATVGSPDSPEINLFHANPDWLLRMLPGVDDHTLAPGKRLNACVPFWELAEMPTGWLPLLAGMDILLAPTKFIADAIRTSLPDTPVVPLPQAVFLPGDISSDRARFGIPDDVFAVSMSFAGSSGVDRKNPWAAVEAFLGAFPGDTDVRLVVRLNDQAGSEPGDTLTLLRKAAAEDSRIVLVTGDLDYRETLTMYASCDTYLSMHRSEGLGLGPMEAMSLGLPVLATGWSGNMDFMTAENSFPIPYQLVPVDVADSSPYAAGVVRGSPVWAEPDVGEASQVLRRIRDDVSLRRDVGARAAAAMEDRRNTVLDGDFIEVLGGAYKTLRAQRAARRSEQPERPTLKAIHREARWRVMREGIRARAAGMLRWR